MYDDGWKIPQRGNLLVLNESGVLTVARSGHPIPPRITFAAMAASKNDGLTDRQFTLDRARPGRTTALPDPEGDRSLERPHGLQLPV